MIAIVPVLGGLVEIIGEMTHQQNPENILAQIISPIIPISSEARGLARAYVLRNLFTF